MQKHQVPCWSNSEKSTRPILTGVGKWSQSDSQMGFELAFFYRWSSQKVWNSVNRSPQSKLFFSTIWSNLELVFCSNKLPKFIPPFLVIFWILGRHPKNFIKVRKIFQGIVLPVCTKNCLPFWKIGGNFVKSCLFCLLLIRIRAPLLLMEEILHQSIPKRSHLIIHPKWCRIFPTFPSPPTASVMDLTQHLEQTWDNGQISRSSELL